MYYAWVIGGITIGNHFLITINRLWAVTLPILPATSYEKTGNSILCSCCNSHTWRNNTPNSLRSTVWPFYPRSKLWHTREWLHLELDVRFHCYHMLFPSFFIIVAYPLLYCRYFHRKRPTQEVPMVNLNELSRTENKQKKQRMHPAEYFTYWPVPLCVFSYFGQHMISRRFVGLRWLKYTMLSMKQSACGIQCKLLRIRSFFLCPSQVSLSSTKICWNLPVGNIITLHRSPNMDITHEFVCYVMVYIYLISYYTINKLKKKLTSTPFAGPIERQEGATLVVKPAACAI